MLTSPLKIADKYIDTIIIYGRKYNYSIVANKLQELGYLVGEPKDGYQFLVYDHEQKGWGGQNQNISPNSISWEIFMSYENIDFDSNYKQSDKKQEDVIHRIAKLFETNEFLIQARNYFPDTVTTEEMMADLGKQIHDLILDIKK